MKKVLLIVLVAILMSCTEKCYDAKQLQHAYLLGMLNVVQEKQHGNSDLRKSQDSLALEKRYK